MDGHEAFLRRAVRHTLSVRRRAVSKAWLMGPLLGVVLVIASLVALSSARGVWATPAPPKDGGSTIPIPPPFLRSVPRNQCQDYYGYLLGPSAPLSRGNGPSNGLGPKRPFKGCPDVQTYSVRLVSAHVLHVYSSFEGGTRK